MSPVSITILFNIYVRELGMKVAHCKHEFKYLMVHRDGISVEKSRAGFLYVCMSDSKQ